MMIDRLERPWRLTRQARLLRPAGVLLVIVVIIGALLLPGCEREPASRPGAVVPETASSSNAPSRPTLDLSGTRRMASHLDRVIEGSSPLDNPFLNRRRAELLGQRLEADLPLDVEIDTRMRRALELLRAGESEAAVEELELLPERIEKLSGDTRRALAWAQAHFLALAYLRLGEQENCVARHTAASCILPIREEGRHLVERGSRNAIRHFRRALELHPADLASRWLLNLAHMTLGEYPDAVDPALRIPAEVLRSSVEFPEFPEVAGPAGVAVRGLSGGVVLEDLDGDGDLDLAASSWGLRDPLRVFLNDGRGKFTPHPRTEGLEGITGGLNLIHADPDNDGDVDILVLRGAWMGREGRHPNSYLENLGDGTFVDATERVGLLSFHPTQTAVWLDFDSDGWLDLFVGNESDDGEAHPCELFWNRGNGTFIECAALQGLDVRAFVKGVAAGDVNGDGRPDLYLSCLGEPNRLFVNEGAGESSAEEGPPRWRFRECAREQGVEEPLLSFPVWFWDHDQDGRDDLLVLSYGWEATAEKVAADLLGGPLAPERPRLYRNTGEGRFEDVTRQAGLDRVLIAMGTGYGDLDSDGWPDFYAGTGEPSLGALMPNRMFLNRDGVRFDDVSFAGGFAHLQKGHGVAFGDVDGDGDQDVYAVLGGAYEGDAFGNALFQNPGFPGNSYVRLKLVGTRAARSAIGARVRVEAEDAGGREIRRHATVGPGGSFGSTTLTCEIGLGPATRIRAVTVTWPDRENSRSRHEDLEIRATHVLVQPGPESR